MSSVLIVLQGALVVLAWLVSCRYDQDRPYVRLVGYILFTDIVRYWLLAMLSYVDNSLGTWILFWAIDVIWLSWFIAHWLMSLAYSKQSWGLLAVVVMSITIAISGVVSSLHLTSWRILRFYSPRLIWLRCFGLLTLLLALRQLFLLILSKKRCRGMGLGLASTLISVVQLLQWNTENSFKLYEVGLAAYLIMGIALYTSVIYKELKHGKWKWANSNSTSTGC